MVLRFLVPLGGDYHGARVSSFNPSDLDAGIPEGEIIGSYYPGFVPIPCTNCHDPHGSPNSYHLRESVNWTTGISIGQVAPVDAMQLCSSCHRYYHSATLSPAGCFECHYHRGTDYKSGAKTF